MPIPQEIIPLTKISERPGSGTIQFGKNGITGTRKWQCPWFLQDGRSYLDFIQAILGMNVSGPNNTPIIQSPDAFSPELPFLYCQEVDMEPEDIYGVDGWGRAMYRRAILTCKYSAYEMGESFHLAAQMFTCRENSFSWLGPLDQMPKRPAKVKQDQASVLYAQAVNAVNKLEKILAAIQAKDFNLLQDNGDGAVVFIDDDDGGVGGPLAAMLAEASASNRLQQDVASRLERMRKIRDSFSLKVEDPENVDLAVYLQQLEDWYTQQVVTFRNSGVTDAVYAAQNGGGNPVDIPVGKVIPLGEYTLERHFVLTPNFLEWVSMMGCVNNSYFLGFPAWTLMFSGVDGKRTLLPNGTRCWDITLKFLFNPNGHNLLYRPIKGRFEVIVTTGTSLEGWLSSGMTGWVRSAAPLHRYLYEPIDFTPLLTYSPTIL